MCFAVFCCWIGEGDVFYYTAGKEDIKRKVVLSVEEIAEILRHHHSDAMGGHSGINATLNKVSMYYHWNGMKDDIQEYVSSSLFILVFTVWYNHRWPIYISHSHCQLLESSVMLTLIRLCVILIVLIISPYFRHSIDRNLGINILHYIVLLLYLLYCPGALLDNRFADEFTTVKYVTTVYKIACVKSKTPNGSLEVWDWTYDCFSIPYFKITIS